MDVSSSCRLLHENFNILVKINIYGFLFFKPCYNSAASHGNIYIIYMLYYVIAVGETCRPVNKRQIHVSNKKVLFSL